MSMVVFVVSFALEWSGLVTFNDISVIHGKIEKVPRDICHIYVTSHRCVGGLKKTLDLRSGSHVIDIS